MKRAFTLAAWSALGTVVGSMLVAQVYYFAINPIGPEPALYAVQWWNFLVWSLWILLAPALIVMGEHIAGMQPPRWRHVAIHLGAATVVIALHAPWYAWMSSLFSPYVSLQEFPSALRLYGMYTMPVTLVLYGALAVGAARAVTARKALAESERKFQSIFDNAIVGIFQTTPDGRVLMFNRSAANELGYDSPEEAILDINDIGQQFYADPAERERYVDAIRREGYVSGWMSRLRRRDGSLMWNVENSRGVFDSNGELRYIEGTIKDVTAEVEAQEALRASEQKAAELRVQLADAQLRALKLQLRPHFLFNMLNTISMMIHSGNAEAADRVVTLLGKMFRGQLEYEGEDMLTLEEELSFVDTYLELQQYRFEDRMTVVRDVDDDALGVKLPALILQPLVENAVKHGVSRVRGHCRVDISAHLRDGELEIEVINDFGESPENQPDPGIGIGIRNTESRLQELYGGRAGFTLAPADGRMRATLRVPDDEHG